MGVTGPFEQAKYLTPAERCDEAKLLIDSLAEPGKVASGLSSDAHWGRNLNQCLTETGRIEFVDPQLVNPVGWVATQRQKRQPHLTDKEGEA